MTFKDKLVFALYVTTSVAVVASATAEIISLAREDRRLQTEMKARMERLPLKTV